jgi:peptidyl-prolyl cis-trans isomerase A (cyclophilin A)/peptidyl-prolyl cis-trans isomerase B (cyclophilin B)
MKQLLLLLGLLCTIAFQPSLAADPLPATSAAAAADPSAANASANQTGGAAKTAAAAKAAPTAPVRVQVVTSLGNFTIELLPERAPLTVEHFLKYVDEGYYSGTIFHRVIPNFVIQGGGFDTNFKAKGSPTRVVNESGNGLTNLRGTVGFARPTEPHAGDVQFYVNLYDNGALDPNPNRWGYAVFGKVVSGIEVVDKIGNVATGAKGPFKEDAPLQTVVIERIERVATP